MEGFPPGYHWPRFTEAGAMNVTTRAKEMSPTKPNHIIENIFEKTCDGFWNNYFI